MSERLRWRRLSENRRVILEVLLNRERPTVRLASGGRLPADNRRKCRREICACAMNRKNRSEEADLALVRGLLDGLDIAYRASSVDNDRRSLHGFLGAAASYTPPDRTRYFLRRPQEVPLDGDRRNS
ncbi:hypothetical protein ACFC1B_25310 [Streptomyces xiamenensis]|uniref:hypothetical protein n=1 Tax=Streptomyces xiamenensis TaxID=408015 RepID=UPI0035D64D02